MTADGGVLHHLDVILRDLGGRGGAQVAVEVLALQDGVRVHRLPQPVASGSPKVALTCQGVIFGATNPSMSGPDQEPTFQTLSSMNWKKMDVRLSLKAAIGPVSALAMIGLPL